MAMLVLACAVPAPAVADMKLADQGHDGIVVEQGTGAPIAGAKVIGKWTVHYSSMAHEGDRCVKVLVVESDASGKFHLPPWERFDTTVEAIDFYLYAYKPGYRFDEPRRATTSAYPGSLDKLFGFPVSIRKGDVLRVPMARWDVPPEARADYLLRQFRPSLGCYSLGRGAEYGALYHVTRAIYDEFLGFPPDVQRPNGRDDIAKLKSWLEEDRAKLESERQGWK
jgi:hypothetical protein